MKEQKDRPRAAFLRDISIFQHGEDKADDAEDGGDNECQTLDHYRGVAFSSKRVV